MTDEQREDIRKQITEYMQKHDNLMESARLLDCNLHWAITNDGHEYWNEVHSAIKVEALNYKEKADELEKSFYGDTKGVMVAIENLFNVLNKFLNK